MSSLLYIIVFSVAAVVLSIAVGYIYGRQRSKEERAATAKALMVLLKKTEQLSNDVDIRTAELETVGRSVEELNLSGELADLQQALLRQIEIVIHSNKKLEDDLVCAHYALEEQAQELDRTRREARTDPLAGLSNRKCFDETLRYWLSNSKRERTRFTLVLADVDHFKWINDTHGHLAGDRVVKNIGDVLRRQVREADYLARFGGDEFAILLALNDPQQAVEIAERVRSALCTYNFDVGPNGECLAVTFSMGVALSRENDSFDSLIQRADEALYQSKQAGRNCLHCADEEAVAAEIGA